MKQSFRLQLEDLIRRWKYHSSHPIIDDIEKLLQNTPLTHSEFIQSKGYLKYKPSWDNVDEKQKYLCWSQYTEWFFYDQKDPWYSTNFVEYVEDRNGNQVKPK